MYNQGIRQYQKTNIESTTPERLIVMLYEGAIRNLQNARTALREHDLEHAQRTIAPLYDAWRRIPAGSSPRSAAGPLPATAYGTNRPAGQESEAVENHELCLTA